jgi:hypothetical protein
MNIVAPAAPRRRKFLKAAGASAVAIAASARVRSAYADYPDRTVKIVVANTPGGPSDIVGRIVSAALQQSEDFHHREPRRRRRQSQHGIRGAFRA